MARDGGPAMTVGAMSPSLFPGEGTAGPPSSMARPGNGGPAWSTATQRTWSLPQVLWPVALPCLQMGMELPSFRSWGLSRPERHGAWPSGLADPNSCLLRVAPAPTCWALSHREHGQDQRTPGSPGHCSSPLPHGRLHTGHPSVSRDPDPGVLAAQCQESPEPASEEEGGLGLPFTDSHPTHPAEVLISSFWNIPAP